MLASLKPILPVLMMVCLFSFVIRGLEVWSGVKSMTGSALAVESSEEIPPEDQMSEKMDSEKEIMAKTEEGDSESEKAEDEITDEVLDELEEYDEVTPIQAELAADLVKQRKRLDSRERELIQKEALLQAAEQELDQKYQELLAIRSDIENLLVTQSEEENKQIESLVKIYENMKAKQAATIFNTLDIDILVEVVSRMSERKVSPILAAMNPERARTVTIMLAEQKKLPELPAVQ